MEGYIPSIMNAPEAIGKTKAAFFSGHGGLAALPDAKHPVKTDKMRGEKIHFFSQHFHRFLQPGKEKYLRASRYSGKP